MDKISAVLIIGIVVLVMTCGFIVYSTWIDRKVDYEVMVLNCGTFELFKKSMQGFEPRYL